METLLQSEQSILQNKEKFNVMITEMGSNSNVIQEKLITKMQTDLIEHHKKLIEKKKRL